METENTLTSHSQALNSSSSRCVCEEETICAEKGPSGSLAMHALGSCAHAGTLEDEAGCALDSPTQGVMHGLKRE